MTPSPVKLLPLVACLLFAAPALGQELSFDPRQRVFRGRGVPDHEAWGVLSGKIRDLEHGRRARYYVAVVQETALPLPRKAEEILRAWRSSPRFTVFDSRAYLVVASISAGDLTISPPAEVRDGLALTPRELESMIRPHVTRLRTLEPQARVTGQGLETLGREVLSLLRGFEERVEAKELERRTRRLRDSESQEDLSKKVSEEARGVSRELHALELRVLELEHEGFAVERARELSENGRRAFAAGLDSVSFDPQGARDQLQRARQLMGQASGVVGGLEEARRRYAEVQPEVQSALQGIEGELEGEGAQALSAQIQRDAKGDVDAARRLLMEGEAKFERKRPLEALDALERARARIKRGRERLEPPREPAAPAEEARSSAWQIPLLVLAGLVLLALGLGLLIHMVRRAELQDEADELAAATRRMADQLRREVLALRKLYVAASKPAGISVPSELLPSPPPTPKRFRGVTKTQLSQAWSELESLHSLWRSLEQALVLHRALRGEATFADLLPLQRSIHLLNDVPARNLPVTRIRACASQLERLATVGAASESLLEETALVVRHAEQGLEQVLQAGHSTHSFDDAYADLVERAVEAALLASSDPVRSTRLAQEAHREAVALDERIRRTLELSAQVDALGARLRPLAGGAPLPSPQALAAWGRYLVGEVGAQLNEGQRDGAEQTLLLAAGLATQAERGGEREPDLAGLREELKEAMGALEELKRDFHPGSWDDLQSALLRAAARIELLDEALDEGRVEGVPARVAAIERSLLAISIRQLALQGQRERSVALLEQIDGRTQAIENFAQREGEALHTDTRAALTRLRSELTRLRELIHGGSPVRWDRTLLDLQGAESCLSALRQQAGEDVLRYRRGRILSKSLLDKKSELVKFLERRTTSPGAKTRLQGADALGEKARRSGTEGNQLESLFFLQEAVRAVMDARDVAFRVQRDKVPDPGVLGDAQNAILIAGQALGQASRFYVRGLVADPSAGWELLSDAKVALDEDPPRALQLAEQATQAAAEAVVAARLREVELSDSHLREAEGWAEAQRDAREHAQTLVQQQERHRRARFEILILGEEPDLDEVEVDLDAEEDDPDELEALEEVAAEEAEALSAAADAAAEGEPAASEEAPAEEASAEEASAEEASAEEAPAEEAPAEEAAAEEAPAEEAPAEEAPAEEAPAEEASADEAPAEEASAEEAPAEEASAEEASADEAPAEETSAEEAPAEEAPAEGVAPSEEAPAEEAAADEAAASEESASDDSEAAGDQAVGSEAGGEASKPA